jgi:hypothetical protein
MSKGGDMDKKGLVAAVFLSTFLGVLFIFFGGMSLGFSVESVTFLGVAGAVFGMIGAPEIEPKAFKHPILWQVFFSSVGSVLFATALRASAEGYVLAILIGLVLGYLAPYWIKHIQVP